MAKMYGKKSTSKACKHYINGHYYTDYEIGHILWQCGQELPITAPRNMQQGYVKAAKEQDHALVASMKHAERQGTFQFLPKYRHVLSYTTGNPLRYGQESRYPVRKARAGVERAVSSTG